WTVCCVHAYAKDLWPLGRKDGCGPGHLDGLCLSLFADSRLLARAVCCCCRWKLFSSLRANSSSAAVSPRLAALPWTGGRVVLHASPGGRNCGPGCDPHQHAVSPADHRLALAQAATPGLSPAVSHVALSNSCPAGRYWIHLCTVYTQRMDEGGPLRP